MGQCDSARAQEPTVQAAVLGPVAAFAATLGFDPAEFVARSGTDLATLYAPGERLPERVGAEMWDTLYRRFPTSPLTVRFVEAAPLTVIASISFLARHAPTIRDVLRLMLRHQAHASEGVVITLRESGRHAALDVDVRFPSETEAAHEVTVCTMTRVFRQVLGLDFVPERVLFRSPPRGSGAAFSRFFAAPVSFEQSGTSLVFERSLLDMPSPDRNPDFAAFAETYLRAATGSETPDAAAQEMTRLEQAIADCVAEGVHMPERIAAEAGMSLRKAQRTAASHCRSLGALIRDERFERIQNLASDPRLTADDLAELTGYSDERSFRRAFKAWAGQTLSTYRNGVAG
ncbi:MAG: AraC family transcriptional regulator ligand-binding domain-containing protein [Pseudomonadota bacterium]